MEVDLLDFMSDEGPELYEIKACMTVSKRADAYLARVGEMLGVAVGKRGVVYRGAESYVTVAAKVLGFESFVAS